MPRNLCAIGPLFAHFASVHALQNIHIVSIIMDIMKVNREREMKEIPLTRGKVALVNDEDYEVLGKHKWTAHSCGYAYREVKGPGVARVAVLMHRVIVELASGSPIPAKMQVDHINGDRLDNTRANLRLATQSQNNANSKKRAGRSRYRGIAWYKPYEKWMVRLTNEGKNYFLGYYHDEQDAARAYDKAAREHFGEFARLNFPDE